MKFEDLSGRHFGDLKVVERDFTKKKTSWICECTLCGKKVSILAYNLKNGNSTNCGCKRNKKTSERCRKDLSGQTFGSAYVQTFDRVDQHGHSYFKCKCLQCGKDFVSSGTALLTGQTKSCGCLGKINREIGRNQTLTEAHDYKTNVGKLQSAKPLKSNKTTGVRGVCFIKSQGKYKAYITFQGISYVLKYSTEIEECIKARLEAEKNLYDNFLKWYDSHKKKEENL